MENIYRHVPTRKLLPILPRFEPTALDHTAMKAFKECPRKYFYRMVLALIPTDGKRALALEMGQVVHKFAEALYNTGNFDRAAMVGLIEYKKNGPPPHDVSKDDQIIYDVTRALKLFKLVHDFYIREKERGNVEVLGVEEPFFITFPDGQATGGRMDQRTKLGTKVWPRDWKVTKKEARWFATGFNPNDQATRYIYGSSVLNGWKSSDRSTDSLRYEGMYFLVVQNMITEKSLKIEPFVITKTTQELLDWEADQMMWHKIMDNCRQLDSWPKTEVGCGWCDYRRLCTNQSDDGRLHQIENTYAKKPWNFRNMDQEILV